MNPKIIYPVPRRQIMFYKNLRNIIRIVFIVSALACVIVNIATKTKPWSIVALWSLFTLWQLIFSVKLVEFSFFSHLVRMILHVVILLILIDKFLAPGWASTVVPIVLFSCLLLMLIYFYITYDKKDRYLLSIFVLGLLSIIQIPYFNHTWPITNWVSFSFQIAIFVLFMILLISNFKDIIFELKARLKIRNKF